MTTIKWMDLKDIGVYFGSYKQGDVNGLSVVDMTGAYAKEIAKLGFAPVANAYAKDVYVKPNFGLTPQQLREAFGGDKLRWVQGSREEIDRRFRTKVKEKTNANARALYAQAQAIGVNDAGEVVFDSPSGRFVQREVNGKKAIVRDDGLDLPSFLYARTQADLRRVARGFVRRIVSRNNNLRWDHVKALMAQSNKGGFSERDYQEAIETEANLLLQQESAKHLARGWDAMGVFDIANRIYIGMPKLGVRTASSIARQQYSTPGPLSVIAQAMLAPRDGLPGRSVLDPTIGNASLVTTFNAGRAEGEPHCRIYGVELDEDRVAAARDFADKVLQGDATETDFRSLFAQPDGFDYVIANPPFGSMESMRDVVLPEGSSVAKMPVRRLDHYILLETLHARKDTGRGVFITGADGAVGDGAVDGRSKHLLAYLMDHYHIDGVVDVSGDLYKKQGAAFPLRLYVVGARRAEPIEAEVPTRLPVLHSYDTLRKWAEAVIERRDNPLVTPEPVVQDLVAEAEEDALPRVPRVMSPEASARARREMARHNGMVEVARYLAGKARTVSTAQHRFAVDGKVLALDVPRPNMDASYATQAVFWWEERNPRVALRTYDGRFAVVSLQRKRGEFSEVNVLEVGEAAQQRFVSAYERLREAEGKPLAAPATAHVAAGSPTTVTVVAVTGQTAVPASQPAPPADFSDFQDDRHYVFAKDEHKRWHQRDADRNIVLDPQMRRVVAAVREARKTKFYTQEIYDTVLESTGDFFRPEDRTLGLQRVERGEVGMAIYYARDVVDEQDKNAAIDAARSELALQPGLLIGTVMFNDFKVVNRAAIKAIDGRVVTVEAKRGRNIIHFTTDALAIKNAIARAVEQGKRKAGPAAQPNVEPPASDFDQRLLAAVADATGALAAPDNDGEEALRTLEVDLPDLRTLAESLAKGIHPGNGKPIGSEGIRRNLLTQLELLAGSVQSVKDARPGDAEVAALVDEAIEAARQAIDASEPLAPLGAELAQPEAASAPGPAKVAPWAMTGAQWLAAQAALGRTALMGSHPGGAEAERIGEKARLAYGVTEWFHHRAMRGDEQARDWVLEGNRVTHEDVVRKALAEGKPVPAHVLADYPDLQAPLEAVASPQALALQTRVDGMRGVVATMSPFKDLPPGWIVMNAPRPLLGDELVENGELAHGRFYAAIDLASSMAERYLDENARLDAHVLFAAEESVLAAMALQAEPARYHTNYMALDEAERMEILVHKINDLNRGEGHTYGALRAFAAKGWPEVTPLTAQAGLRDSEDGDADVELADASSGTGTVPISAKPPTGSPLVAEAMRLAQTTKERSLFRQALMTAFSGAVDSDRAALYAQLGLQRGVSRTVLMAAFDTFWDSVERAEVVEPAGDTQDDANLGRKWQSAAGEVEIVGYYRGNPERYQTHLNGRTMGGPLVDRADLEARIALDTRQAEDMAVRRAAQADREAAAERARLDAQDIDGFGDAETPQRRGKIVATLQRTYTLSGRPAMLRDHIRRMVAEGHRITLAPDGMRRLSDARNAFFDERDLLKTGMDYAEHLLGLQAGVEIKMPAGAVPAVQGLQRHALDAPTGLPEAATVPGAVDALEGDAAAAADAALIDESLDALLVPDLPEGEFVEDGREENEFQQPYVPYSNIGEASMMIPANLSGPVYAALAQVRADFGEIDDYVCRCLQFELSDLERMRMKPEQIDALALIFAAHDKKLGFLLADKMGAGKGRVLALVARREKLEGRIPVFVTVTQNLFTDFLERDMVAVESRDLFKNPLIVNDGAKTTDENGDVVVRSMRREDYRRYAEAGELPPGTDIILMTYAQVSRRPASHLTSRYMLQLAERYPLTMLLDESHNGAGASNTGENLDAMISISSNRGGRVLYSSGTPIKGAKNLKLYSAILPKGVNTEELLEAVASDPLSLQEALNFEIAARGCLISRELDSSNVVKDFYLSPRRERNLEISDQVADILSGMAFLSGDVGTVVRNINREFTKELKSIPESEREGARMGATNLNFGSRLHALTGQLLLALKLPDVLDLAVKSLQEDVKPIIALRRTGESLLKEYLEELAPAHEADAGRRKKDLGTVTLEHPLTFRDYMRRTLQRILEIKVTSRYGEVSTRMATGKEIERVTKRLEAMIDALPDDLPLTPIDYLREGLAKHGYTMAEVSGRGLQARTMENGRVAIEPVPGRTDPTRINRAVRDFNNGEPNADVIVLTSSGSTGISLHASPATGKDLRARRMIKAEMQQDITQERQMDGRHDRTGSVKRPEYVIPLTGLPADDRLAMMFNNANRSLTSSTVANRDSKDLIKTVPDLLNVVGDEVAYFMLRADPALAQKLDINMPDDGEGWAKGPLWYVKSLTGHMTLLRSAEQFALYEDLQARFTERLDQLKAEGRNPLEVVCHDWRARMTQQDVYMGASAPPAAATSSMFNKPVYLSTLEYEHVMKAVRAPEVDAKMAATDARDHGQGAAAHIVKYLRDCRQMLLQQVTGKKFDSVEAALAAAPDKEGKHNETRKLADKLDWMERNLEVLGRGSVFYEKDLSGVALPHVVLWYALPKKTEDMSRPSSFMVYTLQPGSDVVSPKTLSSLYAEGIDLEVMGFREHYEAREAFDAAENGIVTRRVRMLDGNLFEATALNLREHLGRKIVYTDESGKRQHGIMLHSTVSTDLLLSLAERLRDPALIAKVMQHQPVGNDPSGIAKLDDKQTVVVYKDRTGDAVLRVPGSSLRGGQFFLDPVLSLIKGEEAKNRFALDFKSSNGGMRAVIAPHRVEAVIEYLTEHHNVKFFMKDRSLLRKVRNELDREAQPAELAA